MDTVQISDRGVSRIERGHPWIWRPDLFRAPANLRVGPVLVANRKGKILGGALYATRSPVALRLYALGDAPPEWSIALLEARLRAADRRRRDLYGEAADAYRLAHAEADGLPGLLVDRYGEVLCVQTACEAMDANENEVVRTLVRLFSPRAVIARDDGSARDFEGVPRRPPRLAFGGQGPARFHEGEVLLEVDPMSDRKTGSFLDQRENHLAVAAYARGKRTALDCFTYHGGFALQLAHAGVQRVVALDESAQAIARVRENAERAGFGDRVEARQEDAFVELRRLEAEGVRFDLIVLDPPALAKRRGGGTSADRAYKELNLRALRLLEPEGILVTCSCSGRVTAEMFGEILEQASAGAGRAVQILEKRGAGRDHPELVGVAETAYLKCWICRVL